MKPSNGLNAPVAIIIKSEVSREVSRTTGNDLAFSMF
jgi:hypothetical protein